MADQIVLMSESTRCAFAGGCSKSPHGGTLFCVAHGGGRRCAFAGGCSKSVHGGTLFCVAHGGGKRCSVPGCPKSARGRTDFCVRHGGGKRCKFEGCGKSAQGSSDFCKAHGGGKICRWGQVGDPRFPACDRFARGKAGLCAAHGALFYAREHGMVMGSSSVGAEKMVTGPASVAADQLMIESSSLGTSLVGDTTKSLGMIAPSAVIRDREDIKEHMIQSLISHDSGDSEVTTICLIGSSGLGKTTLVYDVYNNPRVLENFDSRIWVCISENFRKERLMKEIIESVTHMSCGLTQLSLLQEVVQEELKGKKFFLVLDDAENENHTFWSDLVTLLSIGAKGSSIVVNTTNKAVAQSTGTNHLYFLEPLSVEDCLFNFLDRAFDDLELDPIIDPIDPGLLKIFIYCGGNPIYLKALVGLIYYAIKENHVCDILESNLWNEPRGKVSEVLTVCYSFMPVHLKRCFAYLSLFPKNHVFVKLDVVRLWMSQGFIESKIGRQPEDTGQRYLDELFQRSFLEHPNFTNAQEDKVVMHELIYEFAKCISTDAFFFRSEGRFLGLPQNVTHLSIVPSDFQMVQLKDATKGLENLLSFLVVSKTSVQKSILIPRLLNIADLDYLFLHSKNIRTLDLSNTNIEELPSSIGLLKQLHYLGLNNTKIGSLPLTICSIKTLQILEVKDCNQLAELPQNMKELVNLRHLDTRKISGNIVIMPNGMGQLTNLQILTTFNIGVSSVHCTISELKNLRNLRCLHIIGIENAKNGNDAKEADLKSKIYLTTLELHWYENGNGEDDDVSSAEETLQNLEPNRNLQELVLRNYTGMQFPIWITDPNFSTVVSITLDNCYNCNKFPNLGKLPSLRSLSVRRMHEVHDMYNSGCNFGKENVKLFLSLEVLNLCEMYELKYLFELQDGDFPCLQSLSISNCPMLKIIPGFPFLVELSLRCCVQIPHISELPCLEYLVIEEFHNIKSLDLPQMLPMLKQLEIGRCSKLSSVFGLYRLTSLEKLKLFKCPKLGSLNTWQPYHEENVCRMEEDHELQFQDQGFGSDSGAEMSPSLRPRKRNKEKILD